MYVLTKLSEEYHKSLADTGKPPEQFVLDSFEYDILVHELGVKYNGVPFADSEGRVMFKKVPVIRGK